MLRGGNPQQVAEQLINQNFSNDPNMMGLLELARKGMVDIIKDIDTIDAMEKHGKEEYSMYRGDYREDWRGMDGTRRGDMRYRMKDKLDHIYDGVDMYEYGKERYRGGDSEERVYDGLEKLMYALCMFVESTMEFAESPREKEIIRKHIDKLRSM